MVKQKIKKLGFVILNLAIVVSLAYLVIGMEPQQIVTGPKWVDGTDFTGLPQLTQPCIMVIMFEVDCEHCHTILRWANEIYGNEVYVVAATASTNLGKIQKIISDNNLTIPIIYGFPRESMVTIDGSSIRSVPYIVLGDADGNSFEWYGAMLPPQARAILENWYTGEINDP